MNRLYEPLSGYFWMTASQVWLAALAVIFDVPIVAVVMTVFCIAIAWRRTRA